MATCTVEHYLLAALRFNMCSGETSSSTKCKGILHQTATPIACFLTCKAGYTDVKGSWNKHSQNRHSLLKHYTHFGTTIKVLHRSAALNSWFRLYSIDLAFYNALFYKLKMFLLVSLQSSFRWGNK